MPALATYPFGAALTISRHRLDNGLEILVVPDPSAPVVAYQTWYAVGSRHEREGKTGIAHLFEHLMFNETAHVPYGEYDLRLEQAGADNNAATYLDWTYYLINLPKDALELAVELEAERMHALVLRDEQVESEREVVANERRETVDDDVDGAVSELLFQTAFREHSYRFPTIGRMEDIVGLTTEECRSFYATHYAPSNATVVVVGDVDTEALIALIEAKYGHIAKGERPVEAERVEPEQTAERRVQTRQPTETACVAVGYRSPAMSHADHIPLTLLNEVLFGGRGSRGYRALVEEREVASDVAAYVGNFRDPSLYEIHITGNEGESPLTLCDALDALMHDLVARPVSDDELMRACNRLELSALQELETASGKAESIGFSEIVLGDPAAQLTRLAAYRSATVDDVARAAKRYLEREQRTVVEVVPARTP